MAHIDTTGQSAMDMLRIVEATEGGVLYDGRDGTLEFRGRSSRYTAPAALTLNAATGEVGASYAPKLDRTSLINDTTATLTDGTATARAENTTSVNDYGRKTLGLELATADASEPLQAAWWRTNTYSEPKARAPQLMIEIGHQSATFQASVLALDVGSKIAVSNLPSQSDSTSKAFFVEGYAEQISGDAHTFELNVSPTTGFDVWTVEDPVYGALDESPIAY